MADFHMTRHASARMRQRGLHGSDVDVLINVSTQLANDAWILTDADADREITRRKREIEQLQRLRGCKVVISGDAVVTVCHMRPAELRRAMRKGRENR